MNTAPSCTSVNVCFSIPSEIVIRAERPGKSVLASTENFTRLVVCSAILHHSASTVTSTGSTDCNSIVASPPAAFILTSAFTIFKVDDALSSSLHPAIKTQHTIKIMFITFFIIRLFFTLILLQLYRIVPFN